MTDSMERSEETEPEAETDTDAEVTDSTEEVEAGESEAAAETQAESPAQEESAEDAESEPTEQASAAREKAADEVFCTSCGEPIKAEAEVCPHCGVRQSGESAAGPVEEKNPTLAAVASLIIPGVGQMYNGQVGRGAIFLMILAGFFVFYVVTLGLGAIIGIVAEPIFHIVAAYDAYNQAQKINAGEITV